MDTNLAQSEQITLQDADKFAKELWSKIVDERLFSYQKSDICDYLLYLFNKHDKGRFLDENTNEQNERLLKITAAKIKASKKNISVKFMNDTEYKGIFKDFLSSLASSKNLVKVNKKGSLEFVIENDALKDNISAKLKKWSNEVPEYSLNSEKFTISFESFLKMIKMEVQALGKEKEYEQVIKSLEKKYNFSNIASLAKKGVGFVKDFAPLVASFI